MWIHHWVILQLVNPLFTVPQSTVLDDLGPTGYKLYDFKHKNWRKFVNNVDDLYIDRNLELHGEDPTFGLVWMGKRL